MKIRKAIFTAAMAASLTAVSPSFIPAPVFGAAVCEAMVPYQNDGMTLLVPGYYDSLLRTKVLKDDKDGRLFSITEAKSVTAAWLQNERRNGPGWICTIRRVSEKKLHKMLCSDMSGAEVFAKDAKGNRYILEHPTDVRLFRKNNEDMRRDSEIWSSLNKWAGTELPGEFIQANKGLVREAYDNSSVAMYLARTAYGPRVNYTIGMSRQGAFFSDEVKADKYVEQLIRNARYEMIDSKDVPDGECVTLSFPDEKIRFDFFLQDGRENYVREVHVDGFVILYRAAFDDGVTKAGTVMKQWYRELSNHRI